MGAIRIKGLEVFGHHGIFKEENMLGQKFIVDADLHLDVRKAAKKDEITESVHYGEICDFICEFMQKNTFKLLETVADKLAAALLMEYDLLWWVDLEVKKPFAPIPHSFDTISVRANRRWHKCYIALGSNMGDRENYLNDAIARMEGNSYCRVGKVSDFFNTKPEGPVEQEDFLNGCVELTTMYDPYELLHFMHKLENEAKRERKIFWGPRTLDLDILFYDNNVQADDRLILPHPRMHKRAFVLDPMMQIAPYAVHPVYHKTIEDLYHELPESAHYQPVESEDEE